MRGNSDYADKIAFVTGVSSGIGFEMAQKLLENGYLVYGCSRRLPEKLINYPNFKYQKIDLAKLDEIEENLQLLFDKKKSLKFDLIFLNAGWFGKPPNLAVKTELLDFQKVLNINMTANKVIIDYLLKSNFQIDICLISSSIAGIRMRSGMLSYSVSKAALNAMIKIYSLENPQIFFALLGLCNVDTDLGRTVVSGDNLHFFPELQLLKERIKQPGYIVKAEDRAKQIYDLISSGKIKSIVKSGDFAEIREIIL